MQGGPCASGPLPEGGCGCQVELCVPQRSLRSQRGRVVWLTAVAALAVVLYAWFGRQQAEWLSPGPLTAQHATWVQRCTDCHVENAPLALSPATMAARQQGDNQRCLQCHDLGPQQAMPHGVAEVKLADLGSRAKPHASPSLLGFARAVTPGAGHGELACATCHQEHKGRNHPLARLTDNQCQTCHTAQFDSFTSGHPEFSAYPFSRRTRLQFDHASHLEKHFTAPTHAALAPTSCASCHETATGGQMMVVRGFEQSCGKCHAGETEGEGRAGDKGIEFFRLPGVDLAALTGAGEAIGEWPKFAEGTMTPFMRWMLEGKPEPRAALAALGNASLDDLSTATPAQKTAAARLVWGVKELMADLVTQGQTALLQRMDPAPGARPKLAARTGQFSADGVLAAQQTWLPHLLTEIAAYRNGEKPALPVRAPAAVKTVPAAAATSPAKADDLLSDDLLAPAPKPKPVVKVAADDDLLLDTPAIVKPPAKAATDDLLLDDPVPPVAKSPASPVSGPKPPATALKMADTEERAAAGGWYRRDETNALYYRPVGHADPFIVGWLDATANDKSPASQAIFNGLASPKAPGLCTKCHSTDTRGETTAVNWRAARPEPDHHKFTRFNHQSHFSIAGDKSCQACHALEPHAKYQQAFGGSRDPAKFVSNFAAIKRETCASCHTPAVAGQSCLQCHNYHTGDFPATLTRAAKLAPMTKTP